MLTSENAIEVIKGASRTLALTVKDGSGTPVNLTGARVVFTVKCRIADQTPAIFKDSQNGATQIDIVYPIGGQAKIYLQPMDTQNLAAGSYVFDVWVILTSGARYLVVGPGDFIVKPGVTVLT